MQPPLSSNLFFFFNDTATTEIYTLSLHDALPISPVEVVQRADGGEKGLLGDVLRCSGVAEDRKSTRLNSSHDQISYAVFCLKKKKKTNSKRHAATLQVILVGRACHAYLLLENTHI